jgi:hypothetical protein
MDRIEMHSDKPKMTLVVYLLAIFMGLAAGMQLLLSTDAIYSAITVTETRNAPWFQTIVITEGSLLVASAILLFFLLKFVARTRYLDKKSLVPSVWIFAVYLIGHWRGNNCYWFAQLCERGGYPNLLVPEIVLAFLVFLGTIWLVIRTKVNVTYRASN